MVALSSSLLSLEQGARSILVEGSTSPLMVLLFGSFSCRHETKDVLLKWPLPISNHGGRLQA
jgi:hypothetical protein